MEISGSPIARQARSATSSSDVQPRCNRSPLLHSQSEDPSENTPLKPNDEFLDDDLQLEVEEESKGVKMVLVRDIGIQVCGDSPNLNLHRRFFQRKPLSAPSAVATRQSASVGALPTASGAVSKLPSSAPYVGARSIHQERRPVG